MARLSAAVSEMNRQFDVVAVSARRESYVSSSRWSALPGLTGAVSEANNRYEGSQSPGRAPNSVSLTAPAPASMAMTRPELFSSSAYVPASAMLAERGEKYPARDRREKVIR